MQGNHGYDAPEAFDGYNASAVASINKKGTEMEKRRLITIFEVTGSGLAIIYALLIASNTGNEVLGFALLLVSAMLFAIWGIIDKRWAFFSLQLFYIASAIIGLIRWS